MSDNFWGGFLCATAMFCPAMIAFWIEWGRSNDRWEAICDRNLERFKKHQARTHASYERIIAAVERRGMKRPNLRVVK